MRETRPPFLLGLLIISSILGFSFYLEYGKNIYPCPLCELQRLTFMLIGSFFLVGVFLHRIRVIRFILFSFISITSTLGTVFAAKQIWLQHFPEKATNACAANLSYLLKMFPLHTVFTELFAGSAECTERGWDFLALDLAEWAFIAFIGFLLFSLVCLIKEYKQK